MVDQFRSGDAVFASTPDMKIVLWNPQAERLTGVASNEAVGRPCWEILCGVDEAGGLVCHPGCAAVRLAGEGWPVPCRWFLVKTTEGRKLVAASTVAVELDGKEPVVLHVLHGQRPPPRGGTGTEVVLTPRQREVLELLAQGLPAKLIAGRLGIAEVTTRNHIQAVLGALRCHSQLEAVAEARRRGLV
jgi:DNA-binding CsgD family transcriptional regulator